MDYIIGMTPSKAPDPAPIPLENCAACGREAVVVIDEKGWCVDCFHEAGSCCAGER